MVSRVIALAVLAVAGFVSGCARPVGDLTVFAAASLVDVMAEVATAHEPSIRPDRLAVQTGATSQLRAQIEQGAPADVFLLASAEQAEAARAAGLIEASTVFARTQLVLAVATSAGAPRSIEDLARPTMRIVMSPVEVPIGAYARESIRRMAADPRFGAPFATQVLANVRSEEPNVRQQLAKVRLGEADAAFVYATDFADGGSDVRAIDIPPQFNVQVAYAGGVVSTSRQTDRARSFVAFLGSPAARSAFRKHGFADP